MVYLGQIQSDLGHPVIFMTNQAIVVKNSVLFKTNQVILWTNQVIFIYKKKVIFKTNTVLLGTKKVSLEQPLALPESAQKVLCISLNSFNNGG